MKGRIRLRVTIFPKLFIALMAVVAPLYGIALLISQMGEARLEEELSNSLKSKVDFYHNSFETESMHMVNLLQEYMNDKDLLHLAYLSGTMSHYEFTEKIATIQSKLEQLKGSSVYAKKVSAHILTLKRSMTSDRSIGDTLSEDFKAVRPLIDSNGFGVFYWEDRVFLAIAYPGVNVQGLEPGFILSIELDLAAMKKALYSFDLKEGSGAAIVSVGHHNHLVVHDTDQIIGEIHAFLSARLSDKVYEGLEVMRFAGRSYTIAYHYSETLGHYMTAFIPTDQILGPIDVYRNLLKWLSLVAILIIVVYAYWLYKLIHKPLQDLVKAFRKVENGQMQPTALPRPDDEFLYLFHRFNMMIENINVMVHQMYEQKLRLQASELKQLQAQINPHFLYNTYFILQQLAKFNDNESIAQFCKYLGDYFQYITRNGVEDVPLQAEINHALTYAEIQSIRFNNRIKVDVINDGGDLPSLTVPRLIIQPLLENAYMHGLEARRKQGRIVIRTENVDDGSFRISVEDNGDRLTDIKIAELQESLQFPSHAQEYTGLLNVHRRLQLRFGAEYGVEAERGELGGLKVTLRIGNGQERESSASYENGGSNDVQITGS